MNTIAELVGDVDDGAGFVECLVVVLAVLGECPFECRNRLHRTRVGVWEEQRVPMVVGELSEPGRRILLHRCEGTHEVATRRLANHHHNRRRLAPRLSLWLHMQALQTPCRHV